MLTSHFLMLVLVFVRAHAHVYTSCAEATLKNDDAEDSEEDEGEDNETLAERKLLQKEDTKKPNAEKQPTGRIVGIIKRNWRS